MDNSTLPERPSAESRAWWLFVMVLLLGGLVGLGWYWLLASQYQTYQIRTHDSVSGLVPDAPVEFHGVEVGKVGRVQLLGPGSVGVLLHVKKDAPVTAATVATITSRGLASKGFTGYVYVSLEDDASDSRPLAALPGNAYRQIRAAPSHFINLDTAMNQVNENVQNMTRLLQTSLDEKTIASLKQSLDSLQKLTRTLAADSEKMNTIILNAERASRRLEPLLESGGETAKALQSQVLPQTYEALANLDRLSQSLKGMVEKIDRDPSVLVRGAAKRAPGPGETK